MVGYGQKRSAQLFIIVVFTLTRLNQNSLNLRPLNFPRRKNQSKSAGLFKFADKIGRDNWAIRLKYSSFPYIKSSLCRPEEAEELAGCIKRAALRRARSGSICSITDLISGMKLPERLERRRREDPVACHSPSVAGETSVLLSPLKGMKARISVLRSPLMAGGDSALTFVNEFPLWGGGVVVSRSTQTFHLTDFPPPQFPPPTCPTSDKRAFGLCFGHQRGVLVSVRWASLLS